MKTITCCALLSLTLPFALKAQEEIEVCTEAEMTAAVEANVCAGALGLVQWTDELGRACLMTTFEGGDRLELIGAGTGGVLPGTDWTFQSGWATLNGSPPPMANLPSGDTAAVWLTSPFFDHEITFGTPVAAVGLHFASNRDVILSAYDAGGALLATDSGLRNIAAGGFTVWEPLAVDVGENLIARVVLHGFRGQTAIDDLYTCTIVDPVTQIENLFVAVFDLNLAHGIENSLDAKLNSALNAWVDTNENNDQAACNSLQAFINHVEAQRDKKITSADADDLIASANAIIALICPPSE